MKTLVEFLSERFRKAALCEACGKEFTCGATLAGCWCSEIKLSDEIRASLRSTYSGCLCRKCLENLASGSSRVSNTSISTGS